MPHTSPVRTFCSTAAHIRGLFEPYHQVKDGTEYPAIFMATGETDGRVNPAHSRKMIARLQAAATSGRPVYLSVNAHAGHGIGSSLYIRVNQAADLYSFVNSRLEHAWNAQRSHRQGTLKILTFWSFGHC
jgi:prolyl oligopeptidase PreP (S9A serine peptidase family)